MSCLLPSCNFLSARTKKQNPFLRPLAFDDCNYLVQITIPQEREREREEAKAAKEKSR
ncbi:unnamed protein product, partial [Musa acuminata var. zebrina]